MFTAERLTFHTHGDGEDVNIFHFFLSQGTNSLINQMKSEDDHLINLLPKMSVSLPPN